MSDHRSEPHVHTAGYSSAYALGCSGACSRGRGSGSPNATRPAPPPPLGPQKPDLTCSNHGLAYAVYPNKLANGRDNVITAPDYPTFDPERLKRAADTPIEATGTTTRVGIADVDKGFYGVKARNPAFVAVNHRGYLFAREAGEYTFRMPRTDDVTLLWLGSAAYAGYKRANAALTQLYVSGGNGKAVEYRATLEQGRYYPLRILWANGGSIGFFDFSLTAPDGTLIVSPDTEQPSPYLVRFSCDETRAPRFPAFGDES